MTVTITNPNINIISDYYYNKKAFKWADGRCYQIVEIQGDMSNDAISVSLRLMRVGCVEGIIRYDEPDETTWLENRRSR